MIDDENIVRQEIKKACFKYLVCSSHMMTQKDNINGKIATEKINIFYMKDIQWTVDYFPISRNS